MANFPGYVEFPRHGNGRATLRLLEAPEPKQVVFFMRAFGMGVAPSLAGDTFTAGGPWYEKTKIATGELAVIVGSGGIYLGWGAGKRANHARAKSANGAGANSVEHARADH